MKEILSELKELEIVSKWLAHWGWSDGSGGNLSVRLDSLPERLLDLEEKDIRELAVTVPSLSGKYLLITGSGTRAKEIYNNLEETIGLYKVINGGNQIVWLWGNNKPTSELSAHMLIQEELVKNTPKMKAVIHTHPPDLISLTHIKAFDDNKYLNKIMFEMQNEVHLILPEGVENLPFYEAGSIELGEASVKAIRGHKVVLWKMHGALAVGDSLLKALDYLESINKAARIYWTIRSNF